MEEAMTVSAYPTADVRLDTDGVELHLSTTHGSLAIDNAIYPRFGALDATYEFSKKRREKMACLQVPAMSDSNRCGVHGRNIRSQDGGNRVAPPIGSLLVRAHLHMKMLFFDEHPVEGFRPALVIGLISFLTG